MVEDRLREPWRCRELDRVSELVDGNPQGEVTAVEIIILAERCHVWGNEVEAPLVRRIRVELAKNPRGDSREHEREFRRPDGVILRREHRLNRDGRRPGP